MSALTLSNPKFDSRLTTLDQLRTVPEPHALGPLHKPVPHAVLVDAIHNEVARRGWTVAREQLALARKGDALFGVMDLQPINHERGLSFGFRNATNQSMAIRGVAGTRVFVCDNLAFSGSIFAIQRKNTTRLDLGDAIATGFDKFLAHSTILEARITWMQESTLDDDGAKATIYDVFADRVLPIRLFDDVNRFYFTPSDEMTDCQPRTLWGLHNACTRAMKDLSPVRLFGATVALGKALGLQS